MITRTQTIALARWLLVLNAVVWLALGTISLLRLDGNSHVPQITLIVIAILMGGNALALLIAAWGLGRHTVFTYFALAILLVNIVLTFTDQFGLLDFLTLILDGVILGLVIMIWRS